MNITSIKQVQDKLGIEAEFDDEEAQFLIEFAINQLLALGSYPFREDVIEPNLDIPQGTQFN